MEEWIWYILPALFGLAVGSFLNVLIFRIPKKEEFVKTPSHCMYCGHRLAVKDLIPFFSYIFLKGRCRYCGHKLSWQYPAIEILNGALWVLVIGVRGWETYSFLTCLLCSVLITISVIDWRTFEIPPGLNLCILILGVLRILAEPKMAVTCIIGLFAVSVPLAVIFYISRGRAIGGGDVKLMAAAGLFIGWKNILLALFLGCILGSVIHIGRMRLSGADHVLAMGPYLAAGILLCALFGDTWIQWYLSLLA